MRPREAQFRAAVPVAASVLLLRGGGGPLQQHNYFLFSFLPNESNLFGC